MIHLLAAFLCTYRKTFHTEEVGKLRQASVVQLEESCVAVEFSECLTREARRVRVVSINNSYRFPSRLGPTSWESPTGSAIAYIDVLTYRLSKLRANSFFFTQNRTRNDRNGLLSLHMHAGEQSHA